MRLTSALLFYKRLLVLTLNCLLIGTVLSAQQTTIKDYVLFGGNGSCYGGPRQKPATAPDCSVQLGSSSQIFGGSVGSYRLVKSTGIVTVNGNIYSNGTIELANNNKVTGNISASNAKSLPGRTFLAGTGAKFGGNIDVKGNIKIGSGAVTGRVTHPAGTTYLGPVPGGGNITGTPTLALLPQMPAITTFPPYRNGANITSTKTITPGAYGAIKLSGNQVITFNGAGVYIFDKIDNAGGLNSFLFNFKNSTTGTIKIFVHNDVALGNLNTTLVNGGSATRIFTEVHGKGIAYSNGIYTFNIENGNSPAYETRWLGTVWAPYASINVGSGNGTSTVTGALWSATQVNIQDGVKINYAPYSECSNLQVNAGPDRSLNFLAPTTLTASSNTAGVQFSWQALNGGVITSGANSAIAQVSSSGTYIVTGRLPNCVATDTVVIAGKIINLIGAELNSLYETRDTSSALSKTIFQVRNNKVLIEVIALQGQYNQLISLLLTPPYGLSDTVSNGPNSLIITGWYPINNLLKLDNLLTLINHCRPVYPPLNNSGLIQTLGDSAMRTNYVRSGFAVQGEGIKVGVISDSYNTLPGNPALNDVTNGDLPGAGNTVNATPVSVVKEYPYGRQSDEGRAMLQILHDVAPKAQLAFRSGFISAGDFAQGIRELAANNCDVIVDDITYITEPFFKEGVIGNAVKEVSANGVHYVTAAGNFGIKSYESNFTPVNTINGLAGRAHNFGGGDVLQNDSVKGTLLTPGLYTIVLQWVDDIYSLGGSSTGTRNDLDIYLSDAGGTSLFGVNRNNIGKDPIEVLPFTITADGIINIHVVNASAPPGSTSSSVRFKYIVFRGDLKINEFQVGSSTIVGQGNTDAAITVGAALYSNTPAFGVNPPTIASFSSTGGTPLNTVVPNKPDIIAPNGVNTSVNFGSIDYDQDGIPNFFGTSAAAPHVAGAVALMLEAKQRFYSQAMSPAEAKDILLSTSIDMNTPGFDFVTGYGFINADSALRTFANPKPFIRNLQLADSSIPAGSAPVGLIVNGSYFSSSTQIILGTDTLATTVLSNTVATATLPLFNGNQFITLYTPPKSPSLLDGGLSNSVSINGIVKRNISVIANNKTKKYAAQFPPFTVTVLVDGDSLQNTAFTLADLGLTNISYQTSATLTSNVGIYYIRPSRVFDSSNAADRLLLNRFNYTFIDGALVIEKLAVNIVPRDTTLVYGERPINFSFNYSYDPGVVIADPAGLINTIKSGHESQLDDNTVGLVNGQAVTIVNGQAVPIVNGQAVTIVNGQAVTIVNGQAVPIVNSQAITIVNGQAVPIVNNLTPAQTQNLSFLATTPAILNARQITNKTLVNGTYITQTTKVVDITQESILKYNVNSAQTSMLSAVSYVNGKGIIDVTSLTSGQAITIVNGQAVTIVNGQAVTIVNGQAVTIVNGQAVTIVNGQAVPIVNGQNRTAVVVDGEDIGNGLSPLKSINIITGLNAGVHTIIPGALLNDNLALTYGTGKLTILPAPITIKAKNASKLYGRTLKLDSTAYTIYSGVLMYEDQIQSVKLTSSGSTAWARPGCYPIIVSNAIGKAGTDLSNYSITYKSGLLTVLNDCYGYSVAPPPSNNADIAANSSKTGISGETKISVYPNPAKDRAVISVPGKTIDAGGLILFDNDGKSYPIKVVKLISPAAVEIDVSRLLKGVYFVKIKVENEYKIIRILKG